MTSASQFPGFEPLETDQPVDLLFIAGEHSGDEYSSRLLRKLKASKPDIHAVAIGGENLQKAGATLIYNPLENAVVGLVEVLKHFNYLKRLFHGTLDWIDQHRPKVVCFVDYPGFNLRIARELYKRKISCKAGGDVRLAYYISPQIWAWKSERRFQMAKHLDTLGVIFPFEVDCYQDTDLDVQFVGHPFTDPSYQLPIHYDADSPLLLLPGSRSTPIERIFPIMLDTLAELRKSIPDLRGIVMYPTEKIRQLLEAIAESKDLKGEVVFKRNSESLRARAVLTSSGTISLVCAMAAIPGLIVYKVHPFSYWMAKFLVKIRQIGIANIVLGNSIHPEFLQHEMQPELLSQEILKRIEDPEMAKHTQTLTHQLREKLSTDHPMTDVQWLLSQMDGK